MGGYRFIDGLSYPNNYNGRLNDLWKYNPASNQWAWIKGSNEPNQPGIYGTQGGAITNAPGARQDAVRWTDASGNLWLMGGYGYALNAAQGNLNDLWRYSPATNQWQLMKGNILPNQTGVYGTQGVPGSNNVPGARQGAVSWIDASGNLWLMGGVGYGGNQYQSGGYLNDLWKYNPATNQWTWVKGSNFPAQNGIYGTQGVASATNRPGSRRDAVGWTDASGNLWLMGGYVYNYDNPNIGANLLNDLWKYNPATNQWTWMKGSKQPNQGGIYGTQGIAAVSNTPGARQEAVSWTDATGKLWLMGGSGNGYQNDLWKYDPQTNQWTWMKGSNQRNQLGIYGTQGVAAPNNTPGARYGAVSWTDANSNVWIMGGFGYAVNNQLGNFNDVWKYNPATNQWTWMKGSNQRNQLGVYGTQGIAASSNTPGARDGGVSWTDANGNLWLMGGNGYATTNQTGYLNDLWKLGLNEPSNNNTSQKNNLITQKPLDAEETKLQGSSSTVLYPNPADQQVSLKLSNEFAQGKISIHIVGGNGSIVKKSEHTNSLKGQVIPLNTAGFASGLYFIIIKDSKGKQLTEKLMIQH